MYYQITEIIYMSMLASVSIFQFFMYIGVSGLDPNEVLVENNKEQSVDVWVKSHLQLRTSTPPTGDQRSSLRPALQSIRS